MNNLIKAAALAVLFGTAAFCGAAETITQKPDLNKIEQKIKSDLQQSIQKNGPKRNLLRADRTVRRSGKIFP